MYRVQETPWDTDISVTLTTAHHTHWEEAGQRHHLTDHLTYKPHPQQALWVAWGPLGQVCSESPLQSPLLSPSLFLAWVSRCVVRSSGWRAHCED